MHGRLPNILQANIFLSSMQPEHCSLCLQKLPPLSEAQGCSNDELPSISKAPFQGKCPLD